MQYKNVLRRVTVLSLSGMLFLSGGGRFKQKNPNILKHKRRQKFLLPKQLQKNSFRPY